MCCCSAAASVIGGLPSSVLSCVAAYRTSPFGGATCAATQGFNQGVLVPDSGAEHSSAAPHRERLELNASAVRRPRRPRRMPGGCNKILSG